MVKDLWFGAGDTSVKEVEPAGSRTTSEAATEPGESLGTRQDCLRLNREHLRRVYKFWPERQGQLALTVLHVLYKTDKARIWP